MGYICFRCKRTIAGNCRSLFTHLRAVHSVNSASNYFQCCEDGCCRTFYYIQSYRRHLLRHCILQTQDMDFGTSEHPIEPSVQARGDTNMGEGEVGEPDMVWDDLGEDGIRERVALFLATLKAKSSQTFTAVNLVDQQTACLVSDIVSNLHRKTMSLLDAMGQRDSPQVQELSHQFQVAAEPFKGLESDYNQMKYFTKSGNFIQPVEELFPGVFYTQVRDSVTGTVKQVAVQDTFQRVPLRPLLKRILESPGTMGKILDWQKKERGVLQDFCDGELYRSHSLFSKETAVPLLLYNDDVETVNPLGSKTSVHKLGFIYFSIKSLPPELLSNLSSLFLLAVYKTDDARTYGIDAVLKPIIEEIRSLEIDGFTIDALTFKGIVKCSIAQVSGDNLGLNAILGFTESFSGNYVCRWCRVHKNVLWYQTTEDCPLLRDAQANERDVLASNPSENGLKRASLLNSLNFYNICDNWTPDIMHDILEGVGSYELKLVLNSLIEEKHVTLDQLNFRITSFDYGFADSRNKPSLISKHDLRNTDGAMRQTAMQMWCLLRLLPLMVGDLIPEENKYWELLLLLLTCMELIFSPSLTAESTIYLRAIIQEHHSLFLELYPNLHLKPKHHFMLHYPRAIRKLGSLIQFWAMRFEAKHGFFKRLSHVTCNFRNICKTMAFRHQIMLCYHFLSGTVLTHNVEVGPGYSSFLGTTLEGFPEIQSGFEGVPRFTEVYVPAWVKSNGTEYRPGMTVFLSYSDGEPQFGTVKSILIFDSKIHLVVRKWEMVGFDRHLFAYAVKPSFITSINVQNLVDHHPLHAVQSFKKNDDYSYVSLRYRVL